MQKPIQPDKSNKLLIEHISTTLTYIIGVYKPENSLKIVLDTEQLFVYIIDSTNIRYVRSLYHGEKTRRIKRKAS